MLELHQYVAAREEHRDSYLGNSLCFFTSLGSAVAVEGSGRRRPPRRVACPAISALRAWFAAPAPKHASACL